MQALKHTFQCLDKGINKYVENPFEIFNYYMLFLTILMYNCFRHLTGCIKK